MGSGKSVTLKNLLEKQDKGTTILCLSFRKTFSIEFAMKYNLVNYMDCKGHLSVRTHPRLILQLDSLPRYETAQCPSILIVDEIESILEKIPSCSNSGTVSDKFLTLLMNCKKIVVMDGLME